MRILDASAMVNILHNHALSDRERRDKVFGGDLLLYPCRAAAAALAERAAALIVEAFAPHQPQAAQHVLPVEEFIPRAGALKTRFTNELRTRELMRELLDAFGCDLSDTYFDVPRLRVVPAGGYLSSGVSYAYKPHRDIWYASPTAQVNWWMPVFDVTPERAMSFFAAYWQVPLANNSADFDYGEWCTVGRRLAASQIGVDTRKHPLPLAEVDPASELRIAGITGDLILFSSAQLHATVPNTSGITRFSIDFRTVALSDFEAGRGAPNVDSRATGSTLGDFLRAADFAPFPHAARAAAHGA